VKGVWHYLYRAVDKEGKTVDFLFRKNRDKSAAKAFFVKAFGSSGQPEKVTIDKSGSNLAALADINKHFEKPVEIRQIKYLNNIVEQDHRFIKRIVRPMMGFKAFHSAEATLAGIELCHMLRKGQYENAANCTAYDYFYSLAA
jgi:putative transposase